MSEWRTCWSWNTTNVLSHLKNNHPEQYWEVKPNSKAPSTQNDKSQITIDNFKQN